ncbi:MFS transporter [Baekduia soli]|uniref:MFS transporter n=1 Tax=Baekduia soli TaxID=496014 RepID=A0A5B8UD63_9ACTN|nr:MFS transporter [Baekduia soli]
MVILDVSIVNVALPSIRGDLGFSATGLQWIVNAYTLAFAGFLMLGGRATDLIGRRPVFVTGLLVFAFASLAGGLAQTQGMLVAARAIQGLGGAIVAPATLSIIMTTFTEGAERNKALGLWGPWAASAAPRERCWAACSPSCCPGAGSCSSTCRSAWPSPWPR